MENNRSIALFLVLLTFIWTFSPSVSYAMNEKATSNLEENEESELNEIILISEDEDSEINIYEDEELNKVLSIIPNESNVNVLDLAEDDYLFIHYEGKDIEENPVDIEGYVDTESVLTEEIIDDNIDDETEEVEDTEESGEEESKDKSKVEEADDKADAEKESTESNDSNEELIEDEEEESSEENNDSKDIQSIAVAMNQVSYNGVALKNKTHVYSSQSRDSKPLKSYSQGSILKYNSLNNNWYQAIVKIKGVWEVGYIHSNDVDNVVSTQSTLYGIVPSGKVNVFSKASKTSKSLKSYSVGSKLKYKTFSKDWYEATVYVSGVATKGYIYKNDIEDIETNQKTLYGIANKAPTHIYSKAATNSSKLKSYEQGSILKYKTLTKDWYEATVFVKGKKKVGYIHKSHIEDKVSDQESEFGVGLHNKTNIYTKASTSSKVLKNYKQGSILKYKTFSKNWYEAKVKVNGAYKTGYIHKNHVGKPSKQSTLQGLATNKTTQVYSQPFTSSKPLKGYSEGKVLKYKSYANSWYEARVKVNGSYQTGYIHKKHVEDIAAKQKSTKGKAKRSNTNVYSKATKNAKVLKSYKSGSVLKFKTYTDNWYEARVKVNGSYQTGYIHQSDISSINGQLVYLDAGHGGSDSGAPGNGLLEKDLTLDIAKRVQKLLESNGFIVMMSRATDKYLSLSQRTKEANDANADIFVSIHINSFTNESANGIETWNMSKGPKAKESNILAKELQKELIKETKLNDRGVKDGNLHVNRKSKMPSSLVELGFISNKSDAQKLKQASFKNKLAKGITNGIKSYFNLVH